MVKYVLQLEGLTLFVASILILTLKLSAAWWVYPILLVGPDVSMCGYLANPKVGAAVYNLAHTLVIAVVATTAGLVLESNELLITGIVLIGHIGMDRMLGFGLKYETGFAFTHLHKV